MTAPLSTVPANTSKQVATATMTHSPMTRRAFGTLMIAAGTASGRTTAAEGNTMRAVVLEKYGGPDVLRVSQIPIPVPNAGQVQIQVAYAGLSPTDSLIRSGQFPYHPPLPFVMGGTYSGRITKVGAGVDPQRIGERVTGSGFGGYADYAVCDAAQAKPIPEGFDWKLGTVGVGPAVTAWHLLHTVARVRADDVIVVHAAAGSVGLMLVQIGRELGCKVVALVGSPAKIAWGREQVQADLWLDYRADPDWPKRVKAFTTGGRGAQFIFDGNQGEGALKNFDALAPLGQVIFIGAMSGAAPQISIPTLIRGSLGVRGFVVGDGIATTQGAELKEILPKLRSSQWKFPIAEAVPLEKVADLHRASEERTLLGRGLIRIGGEI